jgi:Ala-tRNA(Pro) deacylase
MVARTVEACLHRHVVPYAVMHEMSSSDGVTTSAKTAKAVVLTDEHGCLMVVVPADHEIAIGELSRKLGRNLRLVEAPQLDRLFVDCDDGAIPALGTAYGLETVIDEEILQHDKIYFVGGDHGDLVYVDTEIFLRLLGDAKRGCFSRPSDSDR